MVTFQNLLSIVFIFTSFALFPSETETTLKGAEAIKVNLQPKFRIEGKIAELSTLQEKMLALNVPAVSIAFMENHEISWTIAEGVIDLISQRKIDKNTVFQAASISKPVFASVLLKYRQEHNLDIDADVNTLLKSWQLPKHKWSTSSSVTLRQLLSNSAGINVHGFRGYAYGELVPSIIDVLNGTGSANSRPILVDIKPGTMNKYSGGGITVAQLVLQDQSAIPLPTLANQLVFEPLGMKNSTYSQTLSGQLAKNAAVPYRSSGQPVEGGAHTYAALAASGLWTTPSDLLILAATIQRSYQGLDESFLTHQTVSDMLTPQIESMGLGFSLGMQKDTLTSFSHGGANQGFRATLFVHPLSGDGIAIMTSSDNGGELINSVLSRVSDVYRWDEFKQIVKKAAVLDPALHKAIIGEYKVKLPFSSTLVLQADGEQFRGDMGDFVKDEIFYAENDTKLFSTSGMELLLSKNGKGEVEFISFWGGIKASKIN